MENRCKKAAHKLMIKLTPGVNYNKGLQAAFEHPDPKRAKRH